MQIVALNINFPPEMGDCVCFGENAVTGRLVVVVPGPKTHNAHSCQKQ